MDNSDIYTVFPINRKSNEFIFCEDPSYAFQYFIDKRINIATGEVEPFSVEKLWKRLAQLNLRGQYTFPIVIHFYYEFSYLSLDLLNLVGPETPLCIEIHYQHAKSEKLKFDRPHFDFMGDLDWRAEEYFNDFENCYENLLAGNSYQLNLTKKFDFPFSMKQKFSFRDWAGMIWKDPHRVGAYGNITSLGKLNQVLLSNSPECLFQIAPESEDTVQTMPIKGTVKLGNSFIAAWRKLDQDLKEQGELHMITDLLRNDLARLEGGPTVVLKKKSPLVVPGLLHQCSVIQTRLPKKIDLGMLIKSLFPGGSVTGAPKKRSVQILTEIENTPRGFYCGSTVILFKKVKAGSINIRTGVVHLSRESLEYHAGGGITLMSVKQNEFNEMKSKTNSFIGLLK